MNRLKSLGNVPRVLLRAKILVLSAAFTCVATGALAQAPVVSCASFTGTRIDAARIGLPTRGAVISAATPAPSSETGAYCSVVGEIAPVDAAAAPILFQVNLPEAWNGKVLQYGGGGLNGTLVSGLNPLRVAPPGPTPLAKGYVTFGTDSGHPNAKPFIQVFAQNAEALENFAYASYKKTYDVAMAVVALRYGRAPQRVYFFGGSEGGREALLSIQRYPENYDGVVAVVPAIAWTGINLATYNHWVLQQQGGWMNAQKVALLHKATRAACDPLDGISDGVISNYRKCAAAFRLRTLRCKGGADLGDECLSDAQIRLVRAVRSPLKFSFRAVDGQKSYPAFGIGGETQPGGYVPAIVDATRPSADDQGVARYGVGNARFIFTQNLKFSGPLDQRRYAARLEQLSRLLDATSPAIDKFRAKGGKLIMMENTADYQRSPGATFSLYESMIRRFGAVSSAQFLRLYVVPGVNHGGQGVSGDGAALPDRVDLLSALDSWVDTGRAPGQLELTSYSRAAPFSSIATRPLCPYPLYPHYRGAGDAKASSSYQCRS